MAKVEVTKVLADKVGRIYAVLSSGDEIELDACSVDPSGAAEWPERIHLSVPGKGVAFDGPMVIPVSIAHEQAKRSEWLEAELDPLNLKGRKRPDLIIRGL